jgi:hypothetical protein
MTDQQLYELADQELRTGAHNRPLLAQALAEAGGQRSKAEQIYWRLRTENWRTEAAQYPSDARDLYLREIRNRLDQSMRARELRASVVGWSWAVACFISLAAAVVLFWAARGAFLRGSSAQYGYAVGGIACLLVGVVGYVICKKDAGHDPFAD